MTKKFNGSLPVELTCDGLDDMGRGVCHKDGVVYFIDGLLPGESCTAVIDYHHKDLQFGRVQRLLSSSPDRVKPTCPGYPYCGCSFTHLAYPKRLAFKQEIVKRLIHKFGGLDLPVLPTVPCPEQKGFRNKVQKPVGYKDGKLYCGFYKPNTHIIYPVEYCESESKLSGTISHELMALLNAYGYSAYNEDRGVGQIRHILIKTSYHYPEALVTIVSATKDLPKIHDLADELMDKVPEVKGVILNINPRATNVILGLEEINLAGVSQIKDKILGLDFKISSKSFFQTNPVLLDTLYSKAIEAAGLTGKERVLDAYCGTGTIGLCMAKKALNVTGVEIERSSYEDAKENAKLNGIKNVFFRNEDATEFILKTKGNYDVVVLDPPRKGTTPAFVKAVCRMAPKKVVYVSCDPSTLARDLKLFAEDYSIDSVQPVDMFPTTHHVETVVGMTLKQAR